MSFDGRDTREPGGRRPLDRDADPVRGKPGGRSLTDSLRAAASVAGGTAPVQRRALPKPQNENSVPVPAPTEEDLATERMARGHTFAQHLLAPVSMAGPVVVQRRSAAGETIGDSEDIHAHAQQGVSGSGGTLPHLDTIHRAIPEHDLSGIRAHNGPTASAAAQAIGAEAYATGNDVAFADPSPSLHTTAHEIAHVIQQQSGVQLKGGVSQEGDAYERQADAFADAVVRGEPAAALLPNSGDRAGSSGPPVQRKEVRSAAYSQGDAQRFANLALRKAAATAREQLDAIEVLSPGPIRAGAGATAVAAVAPHLDAALSGMSSGTGGRPDADLVRASLGPCIALRLAIGDEKVAGPLRDAIEGIANTHEASGGEHIDIDRASTTGSGVRLARSEQRDLIRLAMETAKHRLRMVAETDAAEADSERALFVAAGAAAEDLAYAMRELRSGDSGARERSGWGDEVEKVSSVLTRIYRWVRAGQLAWNPSLGGLFDSERSLRELVGLDPIARSEPTQGSAADLTASAIPDVTGDSSKSGSPQFATKEAAIAAILGRADTYFDHMRDTLDTLEKSVKEPPPRTDSAGAELLQAALEASLKGGLSGLATAFAARLTGVGRSTQDAIKTGLREVAHKGVKATAGALSGEHAESGHNSDSPSFVVTDPRNEFIKRYRSELTTRQSDARAMLAAQTDAFKALDLTMLVDVDHQLADKEAQGQFIAAFTDRLIVDWMNFMARWTSGATNPTADAKSPDQIHPFPELSGFVVVEIDMFRSLRPDQVKATFQIENGVLNTIRKSEHWMASPLGMFPVHRIYLINLASYNSVRISMGPSGIPDLSGVTDEDVEQAQHHLGGERLLFTKDDARRRLLELVFEVNESLTLQKALR